MQKNLIRAIAVLLTISFAFVFYKKMNPKQQENTVAKTEQEAESSLPSDFHDFYNRFHTDSIFQMSRIIFPLTGVAQEGDSIRVIVNKQWQAEDWKLHKPFDNHGGTFERTFTNENGIISETIIGNGGMFSLEKRYSKLVDEWHLIYYQGLVMHG